MYHDYGFIELEPSYPIERDVFVTYVSGSNTVTVVNANIGDDVIGRHIFIDGEWKRIESRSENILTVNSALSADGSCYTHIVTMNEITVELAGSAELTKLDFIYKPTFQ